MKAIPCACDCSGIDKMNEELFLVYKVTCKIKNAVMHVSMYQSTDRMGSMGRQCINGACMSNMSKHDLYEACHLASLQYILYYYIVVIII